MQRRGHVGGGGVVQLVDLAMPDFGVGVFQFVDDRRDDPKVVLATGDDQAIATVIHAHAKHD